MMNVQLNDLELEVDAETAEELKDPKVAEVYYNAVKAQMVLQQSSTNNSSTVSSVFTSQLWKSSKNPTQMDHEATLALLKLREKYDNEFTDKRSVKMQLWLKIANDLNQMGYLVGSGSDGRDKCRQKFANLQSSYVKAQDKRKLTGEGFIKNPPYFEEIDLILGDKHKTKPIFVIDSLAQNNPQSPTVSTVSTVPVPATSPPSDSSHSSIYSDDLHRFNNIKKTVRPKRVRNAVLEELLNVQKANHEMRKIEFEAMMKMFTDQNNKRHEEIMALIKKKNNKKRRASSNDESD